MLQVENVEYVRAKDLTVSSALDRSHHWIGAERLCHLQGFPLYLPLNCAPIGWQRVQFAPHYGVLT